MPDTAVARTMTEKSVLVVLDFDGFLVNSYELIRVAFEQFGLDVGDEKRFRNRRKFLKYVGGGKELLRNMVSCTLPKKKKLRTALTEAYLESGSVYAEFRPFLNDLIANPRIHVGIVSRNFARNPGLTMRSVLRQSGVDEQGLDFLIPISVGTKKNKVLEGMRSSRHEICLLGADEIGDYQAAVETGYQAVIASYGFDERKRLTVKGRVPATIIAETPAGAVQLLDTHLDRFLGN